MLLVLRYSAVSLPWMEPLSKSTRDQKMGRTMRRLQCKVRPYELDGNRKHYLDCLEVCRDY